MNYTCNSGVLHDFLSILILLQSQINKLLGTENIPSGAIVTRLCLYLGHLAENATK